MRLIDADKVNPEEVFIGASDFANDCRNAVVELINKQPTVGVKPVIHGTWGILNDCSVCRYIYPAGFTKLNYCPNCGAKMDLGGKIDEKNQQK